MVVCVEFWSATVSDSVVSACLWYDAWSGRKALCGLYMCICGEDVHASDMDLSKRICLWDMLVHRIYRLAFVKSMCLCDVGSDINVHMSMGFGMWASL